MSLTKGEIAELIISNLSGGQTPSNYKVDPREIFKYVDAAYGELLKLLFFENKNEGEDIDGAFITAFDTNTVYYNEKRDEYYIKLLARVIKLPGGNDRGIRQVSGLLGQDSVFIKISNGSVGVTAPLESSSLLGKIGYYIEGERIFFVDKNKAIGGGLNGKIKGIDNVMVKMIQSIDGFDEDDVLPIPGDMEYKLIAMVKQIVSEQKQTPVDDTNDGNTR